MKKTAMAFLVLALLMALCSPVFAAIPYGKKINTERVYQGLEEYTRKIEAGSVKEDDYINRAFCNYLLGNYKAAIADYDFLISKNSKNEEFYLNRGYLKHISNDRYGALQDYDAALKIKPDYAFAYNNRGVALSELGKNEESLAAYNTAIKINPNYADAYYNRGNLKTKTEHNEEALADFTTAIKLNPTDAASFNNRGVVKRKLNYNIGALSDFTIAIKLDPEDITAYSNRGHLKKRYFDSEGAEEDFKNAIAIAEDSPRLIKEIEVTSQIADMDTKPSAPTLRESKSSQENLHKIANNVVNSKQHEDNIKVATVKAGVLKVDPKTTKASELSPSHADKTPEITTKPVNNPELAECYFIRALQKYILQNRESALNDFNMAIKYNPNYAEAYYYRAAIKRDLKDESFVEDYKKAVGINPTLKAINDSDVLTILKI